MKQRKISELPEAPYRKFASEAERRGIDITFGIITDPTSVILLGALDMIRELSERIEALETASGLTPRAADSLKAGGKSAKRKVVKAKVIRPAKSG